MDSSEHSNSFLSPKSQLPTELYRRPSLEREGRPGKRGRASKPKVKSGCITCKARRVKCDETKPQCVRCQKFGRVCDGYAPEPSRARSLSQLQPRVPSVGLYSPNVTIHDNEEESRYFKVFSERMAYELSGFLDGTIGSSFWTRIVLQESHNVSSIRHAVIALGALSQALESTPRPHLKVNVIQDFDQKHHEQAVLHHLKGIKALNQYISSSHAPQLRNALITCLLFICFETFQGGYSSCIQQIYGGLRLLRSYYNGVQQSRRRTPQSSPSRKQKSIEASENLSRLLRSPMGSENVSTDRVITSHIEEYVDALTNPQPEIEIEAPSPDQVSFDFDQDAFTYSSFADQTSNWDFPGPSTNLQRRQTISVYSPTEYLNALPSNAPQPNWQPAPQLYLTTHDQDSGRSNFSSPGPSSPLTNTPPPSSPSATFPTIQVPAITHPRPIASRTPTPPLLQNDLIIEDIIIQNFARLEGPDLFSGIVPRIPPLVWDIHKVHAIPIPSSFTSFHIAHLCWDFLMDRTLQFYRRALFNRNFIPEASDSPATIARELMSLQNQLGAFERAFQPILDGAFQSDGMVTNPAALHMSLYQKCMAVMLASVLEDSEMVYDSLMAEFQYMVHTSRILIASQESTRLPRNNRFSFDIGVVPALHIVATKCRDPILRREAVDLLFSNPRQEGSWDSILTARYCRWIIACEEDGLPAPLLPARDSLMPGLWASDVAQNDPFGNQGPGQPSRSNTWGSGDSVLAAVDIAGLGVDDFEFGDEGNDLSSNIGFSTEFLDPMLRSGGQSYSSKGKEPAISNEGWFVPAENRVRIKSINFQNADKHFIVRCQKDLPREDGTREERETVIGW
ncbi:hypothetical protein G7Y89_g5186 [Cudoniella acicularis]|uniref:Zn(2)-C6 fungal-type domain-containing protein n=1 Tax=Cudoniella acicularis TaxID=354080 RepID=A0A8H4W410_9HELO|nr:hypothetical protein G7Y89_g5186 [Cudoniella acicularis]